MKKTMSDEQFSDLICRMEAVVKALEHLNDLGISQDNIDDYDFTEEQTQRGEEMSERFGNAMRVMQEGAR